MDNLALFMCIRDANASDKVAILFCRNDGKWDLSVLTYRSNNYNDFIKEDYNGREAVLMLQNRTDRFTVPSYLYESGDLSVFEDAVIVLEHPFMPLDATLEDLKAHSTKYILKTDGSWEAAKFE